MMKILLIFILSLMSVPGDCALPGYLGGSILIVTEQTWNARSDKLICKMNRTTCTDIIRSKFSDDSSEAGRFRIFKIVSGLFSVFIRRLNPEDAGSYRIGTRKTFEINLKVLNDSCCAGPQNVSAFPGQSISILSNYPEEFEKQQKFFMKLENNSFPNVIPDNFTQDQMSRFFVYKDNISEMIRVDISNVTKEDDGVYLFGFGDRLFPFMYFSFFFELQLQVKDKAPGEITSDIMTSSNTSSSVSIIIIIIIIISVCVCVLLIGGIALLIYKLRQRKTKSSRPSVQGTEQASSVYENEFPNLRPYENLNARMKSDDQNKYSPTCQSDSTYQTLDPATNQADSNYTSLTTTAGQSHSQYMSLNPRTRENSVYHNLQS